jgi:ankyrin repeat protein
MTQSPLQGVRVTEINLRPESHRFFTALGAEIKSFSKFIGNDVRSAIEATKELFSAKRPLPPSVSELFAAVANGDLALVQQILSSDAQIDINVINEKGETLLMVATMHGHTNVVDALLSQHADPLIKDRNGLTAAALAMDNGHPAIAANIGTHIHDNQTLCL